MMRPRTTPGTVPLWYNNEVTTGPEWLIKNLWERTSEHEGRKKDSNKNKSYRVFCLKAAPLIVDGCPPLSASGPISGLFAISFLHAQTPSPKIPSNPRTEEKKNRHLIGARRGVTVQKCALGRLGLPWDPSMLSYFCDAIRALDRLTKSPPCTAGFTLTPAPTIHFPKKGQGHWTRGSGLA